MISKEFPPRTESEVYKTMSFNTQLVRPHSALLRTKRQSMFIEHEIRMFDVQTVCFIKQRRHII